MSDAAAIFGGVFEELAEHATADRKLLARRIWQMAQGYHVRARDLDCFDALRRLELVDVLDEE